MSTPLPEPGSHYFTSEPDAPSSPRTVELILPEGRLVRLGTDRGVFSADQVDLGTRTLLADVPPLGSARTLADVGCGYGPIAITMALRAEPDAVVWAVDVNERARDLCRANADANGVGDRVRVVAPDEVPADLVVDRLWSNPPIRVGKAALQGLLGDWLARLAPDGAAELVVHKNLGADSLASWLRSGGWTVARRASRAGYRLLSVAPAVAADGGAS